MDVGIDPGVGMNLRRRAAHYHGSSSAGSNRAVGRMAIGMASYFLSLSRRHIAATPAGLAAVVPSRRMMRNSADVMVAIVIAVAVMVTVVIPIMAIAVGALVLDFGVFAVFVFVSALPVSLGQRWACHQR